MERLFFSIIIAITIIVVTLIMNLAQLKAHQGRGKWMSVR